MADNLVFVDTETTGLGPDARIVEIAAIKTTSSGQAIGEFSTLVNCGIPIPPEVTKIHSITDEMCKNAPHSASALAMFFDFLGDATIIAHNLPFDTRMIHQDRMRCFPLYTANDTIKRKSSCTLSFARKKFPHFKNYKLETLAGFFNIDTNRGHRALDDARRCKEIYFAMKDLRNV